MNRIIDWLIRKLIAYRRPNIEVTGGAIKTDDVVRELQPFLIDGGRLDAQDATYQRVKSDWLAKHAQDDFRVFAYWLSADKVSLQWDCDDRGLLWWLWTRWLYSFIDDAPAQAPYTYAEKHKTPGHLANGAGTERGAEWFDVQLGTTGEPQEIYDFKF